ncbi:MULTISPECIES: hypothetical protein [unclassified Burkholderia]|uniref:hypothetical protein n=1 Tax=unclassified Burkholderia TaxID=2613784 RepID=UPI002ABEA232|nr:MULTISPECIES: hypothetical protein [unclassified Burkholderia]
MSDECAVGVWLAWGKFFAADVVLCFRWGLIRLVDELSRVESWPAQDIARAHHEMACGPIGDILPNAHHFFERFDSVCAADLTRQLLNRHRPPITVRGESVIVLRYFRGDLWAPPDKCLSPEDIHRTLFELAELIDNVADHEGWPLDRRIDAVSCAKRGPLTDLLPSLAHYRARMAEIFAERDAQRLIASLMQRRGAA